MEEEFLKSWFSAWESQGTSSDCWRGTSTKLSLRGLEGIVDRVRGGPGPSPVYPLLCASGVEDWTEWSRVVGQRPRVQIIGTLYPVRFLIEQ